MTGIIELAPAGTLTGLAMAIKLTPAVFLLYFLLRRDTRALLVAALSAVIATLAGFAFTWRDSWEYWTETVRNTDRIGTALGAAAAQLDTAERAGEVVVLDREQVRTAKREAFGFAIPSFDLFDRNDRQRQVEVDKVESTVAHAGQGSRGWTVTLANGQVWSQTDGKALRRVRRGDKVEIRRGLLGSFFMRVHDQPGVRAERTR